MIAAHLMTTPVVIVRARQTIDRYQNTREDWANAQRLTVYGFRWDNVGAEDNNGREALVENTQVFLPPGVDITGHDRVEISGQMFEVIGQPMARNTPDGAHHIEARLRAVSG